MRFLYYLWGIDLFDFFPPKQKISTDFYLSNPSFSPLRPALYYRRFYSIIQSPYNSDSFPSLVGFDKW